MNTYHFLLISYNGKTVRVFGELEDAEFNQYVTLPRVDLPQGWRFVHIPTDEFYAGSKRVDLLKQYAVVELTSVSIFAGHIENMLFNALESGQAVAHNPNWRELYGYVTRSR